MDHQSNVLQRLPGEIRQDIFKIVFLDDQHQINELLLVALRADPTLHSEAMQMYRELKFFEIQLNSLVIASVTKTPSQDLPNIKYLSIVSRSWIQRPPKKLSWSRESLLAALPKVEHLKITHNDYMSKFKPVIYNLIPSMKLRSFTLELNTSSKAGEVEREISRIEKALHIMAVSTGKSYTWEVPKGQFLRWEKAP